MKKISLSLILFSSLVFSEQIRIIPIDKSLLAHENGGNKSAIEAYSDGVGIVTESNQFIDNSAMNKLVYKFGEEAKKEGTSLKDFLLNNGTTEEKDLANKLGEISKIKDGDICDDNNVETYDDKYINRICIGTNYLSKVNKIVYTNGSVENAYTSVVKDYTNKIKETINATNTKISCSLAQYYFGFQPYYGVVVDGKWYDADEVCVYAELSKPDCRTYPDAHRRMTSYVTSEKCVATVSTSSIKTKYTCPTGYTLSGVSTCEKLKCPTGYTDNGTNCEKNINYSHYTYKCSEDYNIVNKGYSIGTKIDSNKNIINNELSTALNSSVPPINNCYKNTLVCPDGSSFDGIGCK